MHLSFPATATLSAFPFKPRHVGLDIYDQEADKAYVCIASGTGLAALSELTGSGAPAAHASSHQSGGSDAIKLDDLAAPDDNTDLNASSTKHGLLPKLSNVTTEFLRGDGSFASPGVGGVNVWFPDAPPSSPHSADDEFDAGSIDAQWTEHDPDGFVTWSMDTTAHMLKAEATTNATSRCSTLYQAVPHSEFAVYAKVHGLLPVATSVSQAVGVSLFVSDDIVTNPTTAALRECGMALVNNSLNARSGAWADYNSYTSSTDRSNTLASYYRIRMNGTSYFGEASHDGVTWFVVHSATLAFTPTHYGVMLATHGTGTGNTVTGLFSFFRVFSGAGTSGSAATRIGRFV